MTEATLTEPFPGDRRVSSERAKPFAWTCTGKPLAA